ncbi:MAG TPA: hypothetical protein VM618_07045 [Acidimicrobiia bacterium]|nr:hypothetical protein [Acidimicrobiia bacterium]
MRRPSRSERLGDERGFTVLEVMIGVGLLSIAVVTILGTLGRTTETARYSELRNQSLDQLRLMAANFGKDVRQARRVTAADLVNGDEVSLQTYVDGVLTNVTWRVRPDDSGAFRFERVGASIDPVIYVVDLTSSNVFSYFDKTDVLQINRIRLNLATAPDPRHPAVSLETDLEMRNVP